MTNALTITVVESEPRVLDTELARKLGYARPSSIRAKIERHRRELEGYGPCTASVHDHPTVANRKIEVYFLNEEQALLLCMFAETPRAAEVRREVIRVFMAWRRGELDMRPQRRQQTPALAPEIVAILQSMADTNRAVLGLAQAIAQQQQPQPIRAAVEPPVKLQAQRPMVWGGRGHAAEELLQ